MNTHLVLDRATGNGITCANRAVSVDRELRHDEQRNTFGALWRVRQAGQNDVDDVIGHVVFASGDKDLGAGHFVGAISLRLSLGAQHAQVGTAMWLGQAHGASPLAGNQLGQVGVFLIIGAMFGNGVHRTMRQAWVHAPRPVGRTHHFAQHQTQRLRQALAAMVSVVRQARPATFNVLLVGFFETSRGFHAFRGPGATFGVTYTIQWRKHLLTELGAFFKDGVDHVRSSVLAARQALIMRFVAEQFVAYETDITQGGLVIRHSG